MNKKDLPAEIFHAIRTRILDFKLMPGVRISDKAVAQEMGVSRTPVREALIRLAAHGLVQSSHNRGFSVREFSIKEVEDVYTLREALEVLCVRLAIPRLNPDRIRALQDLLDRYPAIIESRNRNEFSKADENFHRLIAQYGENQLVEKQLDSLHDQLAILRRYAHLLSENWRDRYEEETYVQHQQIFNYLVAGTQSQAQKAMSEHVFASMNSVITVLTKSMG